MLNHFSLVNQTKITHLYSSSLVMVPIAITCSLAIIILFLNGFIEVIDQDETMYALVAKSLLNGSLPYQDVFDHKPLGIYYLYAAFFLVFGVNFFAIRIATLCAILIICSCLYYGLKKLRFSNAAIFTAVTVCLAFPLGLAGAAGNTEIFQTAIIAVIFRVYTLYPNDKPIIHNGLLVCNGLLVALGFSINYLFSFLGLFAYLAFITILLINKCSFISVIKISAWILLGFVVGNLLIYYAFIADWISGGNLIQEYFQDQKTFLSGYQYPINKKYVIEKGFYWVIPFVPVVLAALSSGWHYRDKKFQAVIFSVMTGVAGVISAVISRSFFNHYWVLVLVPLAILAAVAFESSNDTKLKNVLVFSLCISLFGYMVSGSERVINHHLNRVEAKESHQAFEFMAKNIGKNDLVASILTTPAYLFINNLHYSQKYVFPNHIPKLEESGVLVADEYYVTLLASNPDFIIADKGLCIETLVENLDSTCTLINEQYEFLADFDGWWPVEIYKRL